MYDFVCQVFLYEKVTLLQHFIVFSIEFITFITTSVNLWSFRRGIALKHKLFKYKCKQIKDQLNRELIIAHRLMGCWRKE